jgi:kinesin family member 2/24
MEQFKVDKAAEEQRNKDNGISGDVDFMRMIRSYRENSAPDEVAHLPSGDSKICICVRKRPISNKELARDDTDSVTCSNPLIIVHDCKLKVDGISKYLDNTSFEFDHTFHEENSTDNIYDCAVQPLIDFVVGGGRATVFAYGQTGSGKLSSASLRLCISVYCVRIKWGF